MTSVDELLWYAGPTWLLISNAFASIIYDHLFLCSVRVVMSLGIFQNSSRYIFVDLETSTCKNFIQVFASWDWDNFVRL